MERYFQVNDLNWFPVDHQSCQVVWWLPGRANTAVQPAFVDWSALATSTPTQFAPVHAHRLFRLLGFSFSLLTRTVTQIPQFAIVLARLAKVMPVRILLHIVPLAMPSHRALALRYSVTMHS